MDILTKEEKDKGIFIGPDGHKHHEERGHSKKHIHHGYNDDSEKLKMQRLSSAKRRKLMANVLFTSLCVIAVIIMIFVAFAYKFDK